LRPAHISHSRTTARIAPRWHHHYYCLQCEPRGLLQADPDHTPADVHWCRKDAMGFLELALASDDSEVIDMAVNAFVVAQCWPQSPRNSKGKAMVSRARAVSSFRTALCLRVGETSCCCVFIGVCGAVENI